MLIPTKDSKWLLLSFVGFLFNFVFYPNKQAVIEKRISERLKEEFSGKGSFSREDLFDFYRHFEPELKETTFRWRVHQLKHRQVITTISKGLFTLSFRPVFKPEMGDAERKIFSKIEGQFQSLKCCVWSTKIVNEFMLHIPGKPITILQVERGAMEPVFRFLKDQNLQQVFIEPGEKEIEHYVYETETAIVLQPLVSKSPIQKTQEVATTTLEKLIVDLYCDKKLFAAFQGSEFVHIINNAYKRYAIDLTKLFQYARRRGKETELMSFFSNKTDIQITFK